MSFGLENIGMLVALSALAIPLIIHFLQRRTHDVVDWGAMQFLQIAPSVRRRWLWDDLILLLLRMGLLALLVLALAAPFVQGPLVQSLPTAPNRDVVVILDSSASMGHGAGSAWEAAKAWVERLLDDWGPGDRLQIVLGGRPVQVALPQWTGDPVLIRQAVHDLPDPSGGSDLPRALEQAWLLLAETKKRAAGQVYLLRDRQQTGWTDTATMARWERLAADWSASDRPFLHVVSLATPPAPSFNASIDPIHTPLTLVPPKRPLVFTSAVRWTGADSIPDKLTLKVKLDGAIVEERTWLPATSKSPLPVSFKLSGAEPGRHLVSLEIDPEDAFREDNERHLVIDVTERVPVLLLHPAEKKGRATTFFLDNVLRGDAGESLFAPTQTASSELTPDLLMDRNGPRVRLLVLADVPALTATQTRALDAYLEQGGSVWVSVGPRVEKSIESYRSLFDDGRGWLPARLEPPEGDGVKDAAHPLLTGLAHPALAYFADPKHGLAKPTFRRWFPTTPGKDARTIAFLDNGQPLLIEKKVGRGRVLLCAVPLDRSWGSDFPSQQAYPIFVERLALYLAEAGQASWRLEPGERARWEAAEALPLPATVHWRPPGGPAQTHIVDSLPWAAPPTRRPGAYRLDWGLGKKSWFVVPFDEQEGDPTAASAEEEERFQSILPWKRTERPVPVDTSAASAQPDTVDIWWILLLGVVLFLGIETWFTRRMALRATPRVDL